MYKSRSLYIINEVQIIDSFQEFLRDIETLTYASYINELVDISMLDEEPNEDLFKLLITSYYLLKHNVGDNEVLIYSYELKLLKYTGYDLNLDYCSICGKRISTSNYFSFLYYSGICSECEKTHGIYISFSAYNTINTLIKFPIEKFYRIRINRNIKSEISKILSECINQCYQRIPKSLNMLKYIEEVSKNE